MDEKSSKDKDALESGVTDDSKQQEKNESDKFDPYYVETQYQVVNRLPVKERTSKCFICKKGSEKAQLNQCDHKYKSSKYKCSTHFHEECIKIYNAGRYSVSYIRSQDLPTICPLHICYTCLLHCRKTSAFKGRILQCTDCVRGFHPTCSPASGAEPEKFAVSAVDLDGKPAPSSIFKEIEYCVCSQHAVLNTKLRKKVSPSKHLDFCSECMDSETEEVAGPLTGCKKCYRSFHRKCFTYGTVIGSEVEGLCESCMFGEELRVDEYVVVRYKNSWYPAKVVEPSYYPNTRNSKVGFYEQLGMPGFIVVEWVGHPNMFHVTPVQLCFHMTKGIFHYFRNADAQSKQGWKELEKLHPRGLPVPLPKVGVDLSDKDIETKYKAIKHSIYNSEKAKPKPQGKTKRGLSPDRYICSCADDMPNRCGSDSGCTNRVDGFECPASCAKKAGGCNNRNITNGEFNKHVKEEIVPFMGRGLVATEDLPEGAYIGEYAGEILDKEEQNKRAAQAVEEHNLEAMHYMFSIDRNRVVDAKLFGNISRFINHSCDPNCVVETVEIHVDEKKWLSDLRLCITTCKRIKKGEQLFFNYGMEKYNADNVTLQRCECKSYNCTGYLGKAPKGEKNANSFGQGHQRRKAAKSVNKENDEPKKRENFAKSGNKVNKENDETETSEDSAQRSARKRKETPDELPLSRRGSAKSVADFRHNICNFYKSSHGRNSDLDEEYTISAGFVTEGNKCVHDRVSMREADWNVSRNGAPMISRKRTRSSMGSSTVNNRVAKGNSETRKRKEKQQHKGTMPSEPLSEENKENEMVPIDMPFPFLPDDMPPPKKRVRVRSSITSLAPDSKENSVVKNFNKTAKAQSNPISSASIPNQGELAQEWIKCHSKCHEFSSSIPPQFQLPDFASVVN